MDDLVDFLLKRISEDEFDVAKGMMRVSGPGSAGRVIAECESKRRIIELGSDPWPLGAVLSLLALPYADHPDYRAEWRP